MRKIRPTFGKTLMDRERKENIRQTLDTNNHQELDRSIKWIEYINRITEENL